MCLATNETPHKCLYKFDRRSMTGVSMPSWLLNQGPVYLQRFRNKSDPQCEPVYLLDVNSSYAHIRLQDGRESTVSTSDLAPSPVHLNVDCDVFNYHDANDSFHTSFVENYALTCNNPLTSQNGRSSEIDSTPVTLDSSENANIENCARDADNFVENAPRRSSRIRRPPKRYGVLEK